MKKTFFNLFISMLAVVCLAFTADAAHTHKKKTSKAKHTSAKAKQTKHKSKSKSRASRKSSKPSHAVVDNSPVGQILKKIENRYNSVSFSADFHQESPLPEIKVTETAQGKAYFKKPGKFRWEYEKPKVLHYISDGETLWIHSPADNNVWVGKSSDFFGKGSGATVLTDVSQIRKQFAVSISDPSDDNTLRLKLIPKNKSMGFTDIFLTIDKSTYDILKIISFNMNGEETRITFKNLEFKPFSDEIIFNFKIPAKANVIPLEQKPE
jgi:outer membrane lipoprotein carrier protein